MAYDANLDATFNPSVGGTPTAAYFDAVNANAAYLGGAWTTFTPAWTAASVNPAIVNGTRTGSYLQLGKLLIASYSLVMGSSTTYGTGAWSLALPNSLTSAARRQVGTAYFADVGTKDYTGVAYLPASSTTFLLVADNTAGNVQATVPHTWANTDIVTVFLMVEVA